MEGGGFKVPGSNSFCDFYFSLVGNMPLNFFTFLKLPMWPSRKKQSSLSFLVSFWWPDEVQEHLFPTSDIEIFEDIP